jgi:hypothetical protein
LEQGKTRKREVGALKVFCLGVFVIAWWQNLNANRLFASTRPA